MASVESPLHRVFAAAASNDTSSRDLGILVADVPGMSERVRRYVKLFYPYVGGDMNDPVRAAVVLGPRVLVDIAVVHAMVSLASDRAVPEPMRPAFWSECLRRAMACRALAGHLEGTPVDAAFGVGLSLEYGVLGLVGNNRAAMQWSADVRHLAGRQRLQVESKLFGQTRIDAFLGIARELHLPENLLYVVAHHEGDTESHPPAARNLCIVAQLANQLGQVITCPEAPEALEGWVAETSSVLNIDPSSAWDIVDDVLTRVPDLADILGVPVERQPSVEELCAGVDPGVDPDAMSHEELLEWTRLLTAECDKHKADAISLRAELDQSRDTDVLTGLPNLGRLQADVSELCADAARRQAPLTLLHVDVDRFTAFNHHYGFGVGDRLLQAIAESLPRVARENHALARVGADSFVVALDSDERMGRLIGERLRAAVEVTDVRLDTNQRARVTATVVGLTRLPHDVSEAERLLTDLFRAARDARTQGANRAVW